jgi:hypothetical protein
MKSRPLQTAAGIKSRTAFVLPRWSSQRKSNLTFMKPLAKHNGAATSILYNVYCILDRAEGKFKNVSLNTLEHLKMEIQKSLEIQTF